ncbi:MAG TPA: GTP cyclohydrolase, FolE2/MptA family, partial [Candidatus Ozemobacteraceae bacterium]|nr:GTP cyclohydrolase, FolE2/MptA family [Candidatus Ozemobacteraceae bacterium]
DEKELTERAYARPRFAEDLVREVALRLDAQPEITWFTVETENLESIHAHSAYAFLKKDKRRSRVGRSTGAR